MKILIAHDQADNARAIKSHLKKIGNQVVVSKSYDETILQVEQHSPDIIITDLMYSSRTFQLITAIKSGPCKKIPILILSGSGQESLVEKAFDLGADDYLSIPNKINELSLRVHILAKGRARVTA